jgi:UPF0755 protein
LTLLFCLALAGGGVGVWWVGRVVELPPGGIELEVEPGMGARQVAVLVQQSGVPMDADALYAWFRISGQSRRILAGSYGLENTITPWQLLGKLTGSDVSVGAVTLVEGWNFRQVRQVLATSEGLKPTTKSLSDAELMNLLGRPGVPPEGRFFPDTYSYPRGTSDIKVLQRALRAMDQRLDAAWAARNPRTALTSPYEALILASIIEKETGRVADQAQISAVFHNRLVVGMRLQTDPTVIYGLGPQFSGNLHKSDLQNDTPFNTYTRAGLPPTPIAMPGRKALLAAVQPAQSKALYFVARGDGSSQFSTTLEEHNRAVDTYQRKK